MSSEIYINHTFDYAGGLLEIELTDSTTYVQFTKTKTVIIEDSIGPVTDWWVLYQKTWAGLAGAALESAEVKFAERYAIESLGNFLVMDK